MRCPDCNKFVSFDDSSEPEVDLDINDGMVSGNVRIVLTCAECGTELKETMFDVDQDVVEQLEKHMEENHPDMLTPKQPDGFDIDIGHCSIESDCSELTCRTEGKGRGMKTYYGHRTDYTITCDLCDENILSGTLEDDTQASNMDELN